MLEVYRGRDRSDEDGTYVSSQHSESTCWKAKRSRNAGVKPEYCPTGYELEEGKCYQPCPDGYHGHK